MVVPWSKPMLFALLSTVRAAEHPPAFQADPTAGDRLQRGATQLQVLKEEAAKKGEAGAPQASCWASVWCAFTPRRLKLALIKTGVRLRARNTRARSHARSRP